MSYGYQQQMQQGQQMPQQQFNPNQFMPGVQSTGFAATPATTGVGQSPMGVLATMALTKQVGGIFGSSSSSSSSSKVSIVKYDDHFKKQQQNWCQNNLRDKDGNASMTADEIKANPPLGLHFKDCGLVIPIPNPEAMCATTQHLLSRIMGAGLAAADDATIKRNKDALSLALLQQYVEDCGYGTGRLATEECAQPRMAHDITNQTQVEAEAEQIQRDFERAQNPPGVGANERKHLRAFMGIHNP